MIYEVRDTSNDDMFFVQAHGTDFAKLKHELLERCEPNSSASFQENEDYEELSIVLLKEGWGYDSIAVFKVRRFVAFEPEEPLWETHEWIHADYEHLADYVPLAKV